jgi:hypothetical protein
MVSHKNGARGYEIGRTGCERYGDGEEETVKGPSLPEDESHFSDLDTEGGKETPLKWRRYISSFSGCPPVSFCVPLFHCSKPSLAADDTVVLVDKQTLRSLRQTSWPTRSIESNRVATRDLDESRSRTYRDDRKGNSPSLLCSFPF